MGVVFVVGVVFIAGIVFAAAASFIVTIVSIAREAENALEMLVKKSRTPLRFKRFKVAVKALRVGDLEADCLGSINAGVRNA